jgi:Rad3-related DNA helicase
MTILMTKQQGQASIIGTPAEYKVPHNEWRPHQFETVQWLLNETLSPIRFAELSTGAGKTALAAAMASKMKTVALTRTRSLQVAYSDPYGASILFGKSNYSCVHHDAKRGATAEDCLYKDKGGMRKCPVLSQCSYYSSKMAALQANFCSLNYALWLQDYNQWPKPDALIMDEAHLLSDITLEHCGSTIGLKQAIEWSLPDFPDLTSVRSGLFKTPDPIEPAIEWLSQCAIVLEEQAERLDTPYATEKETQRLRECERFMKKIASVVEALSITDAGWFIRSGKRVIEKFGQYEPAFICRPLTARNHFSRYFLDQRPLTLMMSATIGAPEVLAKELGISEFAFRIVPNLWPAASRPIYSVADAPKMGFSATPDDFEKQAECIAKVLRMADKRWSGIIHVTRIKEAGLLGERLGRLGFADRIYIPPAGVGTNQQIRLWQEHLDRHPNAIIISWFMAEGYDGKREKICILAKTPFPARGSSGSYEFERMQFDTNFYRLQTAWQLVQMCGRTRRGVAEDYDTPTEKRGLVAIVDNSWHQIKNMLSADITNAIQEI